MGVKYIIRKKDFFLSVVNYFIFMLHLYAEKEIQTKIHKSKQSTFDFFDRYFVTLYRKWYVILSNSITLPKRLNVLSPKDEIHFEFIWPTMRIKDFSCVVTRMTPFVIFLFFW